MAGGRRGGAQHLSPPGSALRWCDGCGSGLLLTEAATLGWRTVGVELDARVAEAVAQNTGTTVVSRPAELPDGTADVVHLGDVIEHLTEMDRVLPDVLRLIKPGGLLLAQGPLENNASLSVSALRPRAWGNRHFYAGRKPWPLAPAEGLG